MRISRNQGTNIRIKIYTKGKRLDKFIYFVSEINPEGNNGRSTEECSSSKFDKL
jgi:hypothetical protein